MELELYDYVALKSLIENIFMLFTYLKRTDDKIAIPIITANYRVKYEQFKPVKSSVIENCTLKNLTLEVELENDRIKLLSKIKVALEKLNEVERAVFNVNPQ